MKEVSAPGTGDPGYLAHLLTLPKAVWAQGYIWSFCLEALGGHAAKLWGLGTSEGTLTGPTVTSRDHRCLGQGVSSE